MRAARRAWYCPGLLPLRDIQPRGRTLWARRVLLASIGLVFAYQVWLGPEVTALVRSSALVPARASAALSAGDLTEAGRALLSVCVSAFLHGSYLHVAGNLLYLAVFGERLELRLGSWRFLALYVGAAYCGAAAEVASTPMDPTPIIGASGAIAGVLGAYVVLFPASRITTVFPALVTLTFLELPAVLFVGVWVLQQALNGYLALAEGLGADSVAWFSHLGGFAFGVGAGLALRIGRRARRARR